MTNEERALVERHIVAAYQFGYDRGDAAGYNRALDERRLAEAKQSFVETFGTELQRMEERTRKNEEHLRALAEKEKDRPLTPTKIVTPDSGGRGRE